MKVSCKSKITILSLVVVFSLVGIVAFSYTLDFEAELANEKSKQKGSFNVSYSSSKTHMEIIVKDPGVNYLEYDTSDIKKFTGITSVYINGQLMTDDTARLDGNLLIIDHDQPIEFVKVYFTKELTRGDIHKIENCEPSSVFKAEHTRNILNGTHQYDLQHCTWNPITPTPYLEDTRSLGASIADKVDFEPENKVPLHYYISEMEEPRGLNTHYFHGYLAEKACNIADITCPDEPKFRGYYDTETKRGHFDYINNDIIHTFTVMDDTFKYHHTGGESKIILNTDKTKIILHDEVEKSEIPIESDNPYKYKLETYVNSGQNDYELMFDSNHYELGDTISFTGTIPDELKNNYVITMIKGPNKELLETQRLESDSSRIFAGEIETSSSWELGQYLIIISDPGQDYKVPIEIFSYSFEEIYNEDFETKYD